MKVFATFTLLILFLFSPCSSDALTLASPSWDFNIANLVKHTDLVVLGKVKDMRLIPRTYSTSITLEVETVIKGDKTVGDSLLSFTVFGDAGQNDSYGIEAVVYFTRGERVLLFMWEDDGDYHIYHPSAKAAVEDNKVYMPYTYKIFTKSDNEMAEIRLEREVELPLDLVGKIAKASIRDYDAIMEIEADVIKAVSLTPRNARPSISVELLKRLEDRADQILEKRADEWVGTWSLELVDGERFEQRVWAESFSHKDRETATFINNWTFNDDGTVQSKVGFTTRDKRSAVTSLSTFEGIYTLSGENYRLLWTPPATKDSPLLTALFILLHAVRGEDKGQDTGTWNRQGDTLTIISTDSGEVMVFKKKESNEP